MRGTLEGMENGSGSTAVVACVAAWPVVSINRKSPEPVHFHLDSFSPNTRTSSHSMVVVGNIGFCIFADCVSLGLGELQRPTESPEMASVSCGEHPSKHRKFQVGPSNPNFSERALLWGRLNQAIVGTWGFEPLLVEGQQESPKPPNHQSKAPIGEKLV